MNLPPIPETPRELDYQITIQRMLEAGFEVCTCAAYKLADGKIVSARRHHNCLDYMHRHGLPHIGSQSGFLTSLGRFVTSEEGRGLQEAAGIPSAAPGGYRGDRLYSEDLY